MSSVTEPHQPASAAYRSYVIGFVLSIVTTLLAYFLVVNKVFPTDVLVYVILGIAVVQLIVQVVYFLHVGRGGGWRLMTFVFTIFVVAILVVGSVWIMNNLDENMMHMSPDEQRQYMHENQGI